MRVIFSTDFENELKRLDGDAEITGYSFEYTTSISENDWINSPLIGARVYSDCQGVWNKDKSIFSVYIQCPDEFLMNESIIGEELIDDVYVPVIQKENTVNLIRFLYGAGGYTAFILVSDSTTGLENIDLTQNKNLFNISFPENTLANIFTSYQDTDTKFLEGPGVGIGYSVFNIDSPKNGLVDKESYFRKTLVNGTEDYYNGSKTSYIDSEGKNITDNYTYRIYKNLRLTCVNLTPKEQEPWIRYNLPESGQVQFHGEADYIQYRIIQGKRYEEHSGTECIDSLPGARLEEKPRTDIFTDLNYQIDNNLKQVIITKSENAVSELNTADFQLVFDNYDPFLNKTETLISNPVRITQNTENLEWTIVNTSTTYTEGNDPVFIFEYDAFSSKEKQSVTIHSCLTSNTSNVKIERSPEVDAKFNFSWSINNSKNFVLEITAKEDNVSDSWWPIINGESQLSEILLKYEDYIIRIYVVQRTNVSGMAIGDFKGGEEGDKQEILHSLDFPWSGGEKQVHIYVPNVESEEELGDDKFWQIVPKSVPATVRIIKDNKSLPYYNLGYNENSCKEFSFTIINEQVTSEAYDIPQGSLIFRRISEEEKGKDMSNYLSWREVVEAKRLTIPVGVIGKEIKLDPINPVVFSMPGYVTFNVKSNCHFKCILNSGQFDENIYFAKTGTKEYDSKKLGDYFSPDNGLDVGLVFENTDTLLYQHQITTMTVIAAVEGKTTVKRENIPISISYTHEAQTAELEDRSPASAYPYYIFLDSFDFKQKSIASIIKPKLTVTTYNNSSDSSGAVISDLKIANIGSAGSESTYSFSATSVTNRTRFYPVPLEKKVSVVNPAAPTGENKHLEYYVFCEGMDPEVYACSPDADVNGSHINIGTNTISEIRLYRKGGSEVSKQRVYIRTKYKFANTTNYHDAKNGWIMDCPPSMIDNPFSVQVELLTDRTRQAGYYVYAVDIIHNPAVPITTSDIYLGDLIFSSSISTENGSATTNLINFPTEVPIPTGGGSISQTETDKIVPPCVWKIKVYQVNQAQNPMGLTVLGPKTTDISCEGAKIVYPIFPEKELGSLTSQNFVLNPSDSGTTRTVLNSTGTKVIGFEADIWQYDKIIKNLDWPCNFDDDFIKYSEVTRSKEIKIKSTYKTQDPQEFIINQYGPRDGLLFWSQSLSEKPMLFVDVLKSDPFRTTVNVPSDGGEFKFMVGLVNIQQNPKYYDTEINIDSISVSQSENMPGVSWNLIWPNKKYKYDKTGFFPTLSVNLPSNTSFTPRDIELYIMASGETSKGHGMTLVLHQSGGNGKIYCDEEMYVYSSGTVFTLTSNGQFVFESDLDIDAGDKIKVEVLDEKGNPITLSNTPIVRKQPYAAKHPGCYSYTVGLTLPQNVSSETKNYGLMFYQVKDTHTAAILSTPVKVMQGRYTMKICLPGDNDTFVYADSIDNIIGPAIYPTMNSRVDNPVKPSLYHLELERVEPDGYGSWTVYTEEQVAATSDRIEMINNYDWIDHNATDFPVTNYFTNSGSAGQGSRTSGFYTNLVTSDITGTVDLPIPYLQNIYEVNQNYYKSDLYIDSRVKIKGKYPGDRGIPQSDFVVFSATVQFLKGRQNT